MQVVEGIQGLDDHLKAAELEVQRFVIWNLIRATQFESTLNQIQS